MTPALFLQAQREWLRPRTLSVDAWRWRDALDRPRPFVTLVVGCDGSLLSGCKVGVPNG